MQYLLHTDYLADLLQNTSADCEILEGCRTKKIKGWILSTTVPLLFERAGEGREPEEFRRDIKRLLTGIPLLPVTPEDIHAALEDNGPAAEVSLAARVAKHFRLDGIITSGAGAFAGTGVKALPPAGLAASLQNKPAVVEKVPLLDIPASYHQILNDIENAMAAVVRSGHFIMGPQVAELETRIAEYCQCPFAVGVSSGTDALVISLMAADIGPGDEVITTPFTFFATVGSIVRVGATPVFADIDPQTCNLDPARIEEKITGKTRAILPVHLYGQAADMDPILEIARKHSLLVIEDAAQAIGTEYKNRRVGSFGDFGCFSFFPTKNLGGFGDGGIVTTSTKANYEKLKILRVHGSRPKYFHKLVGGNFRLDTLQAAVVGAKLPYLEGWTQKRRENADRYNRLFAESGLENHIQTPREVFPRHIYNQYVLRAGPRRDELRTYLKEKNIATEIYYPKSLHLQECFTYLGYKPGDFPESEKAANETLALPVFPEVLPEQQEYAVKTLQKFFA